MSSLRKTSQTSLKQTSCIRSLFKTTLFVTSVPLLKSPTNCRKPSENFFSLKQPYLSLPEHSVGLKQACL